MVRFSEIDLTPPDSPSDLIQVLGWDCDLSYRILKSDCA